MIGWCILSFILGLVAGVFCISLVASKKIDENNRAWYQTCLKITDGMDIRDIKEVEKKNE